MDRWRLVAAEEGAFIPVANQAEKAMLTFSFVFSLPLCAKGFNALPFRSQLKCFYIFFFPIVI